MARKDRDPLAEALLPAALSSDDEDSEDNSGEEEAHSSSSSEEETTPSSAPEKPSSIKKPPTEKEPTESESETDSDDSDLPPPLKVKPIASKPMNGSDSSNKLKNKTPTKPSAKRPASDDEKGSSKKAKSEKPESSGGAVQDEGKKVLFQRLWSEEDELVILRGMIEYKSKKETDPLSDPDDFLEFIKKSLEFVGANKNQMLNKVKRLKTKFENAKKKKINNPHELKAFELSKQVWGSDGVHDNGVRENNKLSLNASNVKSRTSNSKLKGSSGVNEVSLEDGNRLDIGKKKGEGDDRLLNWMLSNIGRVGERERSVGCFNEGILKEGMKSLSEKERAELNERLQKQNIMEAELYLKRLDLVRVVAQKTLNAIKSAQD